MVASFHISLKHQGSVKVEGDRYQLEWLDMDISNFQT